jgi:hypothetical protein
MLVGRWAGLSACLKAELTETSRAVMTAVMTAATTAAMTVAMMA